ncbi:MAG: glutamine-hydrolyzing GMP synthase [Candidatus Cloacimonadaceae bacterium]|jgi:GMP synthase (glutamine-hydrolysing)|nr:glutamine-hydrolyzing GMP synthase [Candidatus Cloacimonadaceae bacterium]
MQKVLILDFGSQYTQLIARKTRELGIYSEIHPFNMSISEIQKMAPQAIILSGSPYSIGRENAPKPSMQIWDMGLPILGICYGMQLVAERFGGLVSAAREREYGKAELSIKHADKLLINIDDGSQVWMSHGDKVEKISDEFMVLAETRNSHHAVIKHKLYKIYALQFHPEVHHSSCGKQILRNFLYDIVGLEAQWSAQTFISDAIARIRAEVGSKRVILGLSGGVDSSVAAALLHEAIGTQLIPIFVDTGMMRYDEANRVREMFQVYPDLQIDFVDASELFLQRLKGISDPEQKRKIIGSTFIDVFEKEAAKFPDAHFLAQGTLYPDVIESVSFAGPSVTIKSHHNVGGLPDKMQLSLIEPLRELFKDEVREVGRQLKLPELLIRRHPFPGPGLAVRILGDIDHHKVKLLQAADEIFISELREWQLYDNTWQAFAVLLPIQSVGVMGDERTYEQVCALRAVNSVDGMTADVTDFPFAFLKHVAGRICNEVKGISRVVYDISSKPPATIEWE